MDAQFRLKMILDASNFEAGSKEAANQLVKFSASAKAAGLSAEQLAHSWIKDAEAAVAAGTASKDLIATLERTKNKMAELNAEAGRPRDQTAKGFAEEFARAEQKAQSVLNFSKQIGIAVGNIVSAKFSEGPFARLLADEQKIRQETEALSGVIRNLFGDGIASATTMSDVMRSLARVFSGTTATTQGMRLAVLDVRRAFTELQKQAPTEELAKGIAKANEIVKSLRRNAELTPVAFNKIVQELGPLADKILGVKVSTEGLAQTLRTIEGRKTFADQLRQLQALGSELITVTARAKQAFGEKFGAASFAQDLALIKDQADRLSFARATASLERFLAGNQQFRTALAQTGGSIADLNSRQATLEEFLKRFGSLTQATSQPIGGLRTSIEQLARSMGLVFQEGESVGDFLRRVQQRAALTRRELDSLTQSTERMSAGLRSTATGMAKFNELTSIAIQKIIRYRVAFFLMSKTIFALRSAVDTFREVQSELANIEKVIEPVAGQMKRLREEAFGFAQRFGEEIQNVIQIMGVWAQQGKTFNEILSLTEASLIAAAGAGLTTEQSVEALTAATKAYGISADNVITIVDKLANVQAKFAITAQDLADAIRLIASAGAAVGVGIDELIGQVTAIGEVTRKSGKEVANSLKTIFARFEGPTSINQFRALGIEIQKTNGAIRPLGEVLGEISSRWGTFTDAQKFAIAQTAAGVRRYADFLVLMENYGQALLATKASLEAQGQAQRNASIEIATFARQVNQVQAVLAETFTQVADAALAPAIAGLLGLVKVFGQIQNAVPGLNAAIGGLTALAIATFAVKAAFVGGEIVFGQFVRISGELSGANQRLASSMALITAAGQQDLVQKSLNLTKDKEKLILQQALLSGDSRQIGMASVLIATELQKAGALTATEAATVAAAIAQTGYNGAMEFGAVAASKLSLALNVLGAIIKSWTFWLSIGITLASILAGKMLMARAASQKFAESQVEVTKNLIKRVDIEEQLVDNLEKEIKIMGQLNDKMDDTTLSAEELGIVQLARFEQTKKILALEIRMNEALSQQNTRVLDLAKAYEVLGAKKAELDELRKAQEAHADKTEKSAKAVRQAVFQTQKFISGFKPEDTQFAFFGTGAVRDRGTFKQALARDKKLAERAADNAVKVQKDAAKRASRELSSDEILKIREDAFSETFIALGKSDARIYVEALKKEGQKRFNESKKIIDPQRANIGALGKDLAKIEGSIDFGAQASDQLKQIDQAATEIDLVSVFTDTIDPLTNFNNQLLSISITAADAIKEITKMDLAAVAIETTGFEMEHLTDILKNTLVKAKESDNEFRAMSNSAEGLSKVGANVAEMYLAVGKSFDVAEAKAAASEEAFRRSIEIQEELSRLEQQPTELLGEQFLSQIVSFGDEFQLTGSQISKTINALMTSAGDDTSRFSQMLQENTDENAKAVNEFLEQLSDDPNRTIKGDRLIAGLLAIAEAAKEAGGAEREQLTTLKLISALSRAVSDQRNAEHKDNFEHVRENNRAYEDQVLVLERLKTKTDDAFGALRSIGQTLGFSARDYKAIVDAQNKSLDEQVFTNARIEFLSTKKNMSEEDFQKAISGTNDEFSGLLSKYSLQANAQKAANLQAQTQAEIMEDVARSVKRITDAIKEQRDAIKSITDLQVEVFKARADELGILQETQAVFENQAAITALEAEKAMLEKIRDAVEAGTFALDDQTDAVARIQEFFGFAEEAARRLAPRFKVLGSDTEQWEEAIRGAAVQIENLNARKIFLNAAEAVAKQNQEFERQEAIFSNILDKQKQITRERLEASGASASKQAKIDAETTIRQIEREIERKQNLIRLNDAQFSLAQQMLAAGSSMTDVQEKLNTQLAEGLGLSAEQLAIQLVLNRELQALFETRRSGQDDVILATANEEIERFNQQLDDAISLEKGMLDILNEFDEQSATFNRTVGASRVNQLKTEISLEHERFDIIDKIRQNLVAELSQTRKDKNQAGADTDALQQRALELESEINTIIAQSKDIPENIRELNIELAIAEARASDVFVNALRDSETFRKRVEAAAGSISEFFSTLPDSIVGRFEEIRQIETDLAKVTAEIVKTEAAAQLSGNFNDSREALARLRAEQEDLNKRLADARDLVLNVKKEFLRLAGSVGKAVLEVRADVLKQQLEELLSSGPLDNKERERRQLLHNEIVKAHATVTAAIAEGHRQGLSGFTQVQAPTVLGAGGTGGGVNRQNQFGLTGGGLNQTIGSQHLAQANLLAGMSNFATATESMGDAGKALKVAGQQLLAFASVALGTAVGGGGPNAALGASAGSLFGALSGGWGILGSVLGPLLGGIIGGAFDEPAKKLQEEVATNTRATRENTVAMQDLRNELINAPARFVLPSAARFGGFTVDQFATMPNGSGPPTSQGTTPIQVNINVGAGAQTGNLADLESAVVAGVTKAYQEEQRRFGRRLSR